MNDKTALLRLDKAISFSFLFLLGSFLGWCLGVDTNWWIATAPLWSSFLFAVLTPLYDQHGRRRHDG